MNDETGNLIIFLVGIAIGIASVVYVWNTPQNEVLCLKLYPSSAKSYDACIKQSLYTNVTKVKEQK